MNMQTTDSTPNEQGLAASSLTAKISEYSQWRENLIAAIDEYIDWPGHSDSVDAVQELRLYDIKGVLKRDQLVMAFLAEFSRGKTETINALFFLTLTNVCYQARQVALPCAPPKFLGFA